jgi:hypothetical protein
MAEAFATLELGSLLPALLLRQERPVEAARAYFELARRAVLPTPPPPPGEPPQAAPSARALELRLNFFQQVPEV